MNDGKLFYCRLYPFCVISLYNIISWWLVLSPQSDRVPGFCVEFAYSHECVGSLQVLWLPPTTKKRACQVSWWQKLTLGVSLRVDRCLSLYDGMPTCPGCTLPLALSPNVISHSAILFTSFLKRTHFLNTYFIIIIIWHSHFFHEQPEFTLALFFSFPTYTQKGDMEDTNRVPMTI